MFPDLKTPSDPRTLTLKLVSVVNSKLIELLYCGVEVAPKLNVVIPERRVAPFTTRAVDTPLI
jgi:hypothetical protein